MEKDIRKDNRMCETGREIEKSLLAIVELLLGEIVSMNPSQTYEHIDKEISFLTDLIYPGGE